VVQGFPKVKVPTLVIWGMRDKALLPIQLEGLEALVDDLRIERIPDAGHFVPWEKPDAVAAALKPFLAGTGGA
jgi:pimeloyl-ACP methyl ester carboxylesterase